MDDFSDAELLTFLTGTKAALKGSFWRGCSIQPLKARQEEQIR
jgi:hypothetical protein